ncbi:hypothetical protein V8G54_002592, partial [Vigna mungo]
LTTRSQSLSGGVCHPPPHIIIRGVCHPLAIPTSTLYSKTPFIGFKRKENLRFDVSHIFFNRTINPSSLSLFLSEPFDHFFIFLRPFCQLRLSQVHWSSLSFW